ncbi:MAG: hypothetical protein AAGC46_09935 [Solirubrobacteraceae bacterium]|nr:hypothetical protein [Patulibacter sp.]
MSRTQSPLDRLGAELEAAATRQIATARAGAAPMRRGRWWARHTLIAILVVGVGSAGAVAVAATALLGHGKPVPLRGGAPVAGRSNGAPTAGSIRFLTTSVPDPDGGAPWAMRYWTTDRGYACFQVGRYDAGRVGLLSGAGAARVLHPMQIGTSRDGVSGCYPVDGAGHARIALHEPTAAGAATNTVCQDNVLAVDRAGHTVPARFPRGCSPPTRTVDVGLLGPAARSLTVAVDGKPRTIRPIGPEGAYLVVQRYVKPLRKAVGFQHRDVSMNVTENAEAWLALSPAAHTIRRIVYDDGICRVYPTTIEQGACFRHLAWVRLPAVTPGDVRAPVRAWAVDDKRIRVRFTARQAVTDRRSGYSIALIPERGPGKPRHDFTVYEYDHDIRAGAIARKTISREAYPAGRFTIRVRFRTAPSTPSFSQLPWHQGPLVGVTHVDVGR